MTIDGTPPGVLSSDEVYIYVADQESSDEQSEPVEEKVRSRARRSEHGHLAVVQIDDAEIDRLRSQVERIARRLETTQISPTSAPTSSADSGHFSLDSVTVHVGLSASGHFFFVASVGAEAAV